MPKRKPKRVTKPVAKKRRKPSVGRSSSSDAVKPGRAKRAPSRRSPSNPKPKTRNPKRRPFRLKPDTGRLLFEPEREFPAVLAEPRCRVCQLFEKAPEVARKINSHLITGGQVQTLIRWLAAEHPKLNVPDASLYRHLRMHVRKHMARQLELEIMGAGLRAELSKKRPQDIVTTILAELAITAHRIFLGAFDDDQAAAKHVKTKAGHAELRLLKDLAVALAHVERSKASTALAEETVELKRLAVALQGQKLSKQVRAALVQLADRLSPELRQAFVTALDQPAALPEAATS